MSRSNRAAGLSVVVVMVVATVGTSLALQGWKSRIPPGDLLTTIQSAHYLLEFGRIPDRGVLTSFASYTPPGAAWLMTPGVLVFSDPRLYEYIASVALYFGTLAGIFLVARIYFGCRCALLSVALYGLSEIGLTVAGSLWQRYPLHFFYIWMVYWTSQWVIQRNAKYFAAAVVTCASGMYVFMEIAPALFVLPAVWLIYRRPLNPGLLLLAGMSVLVIWYPYLDFEYARNFVDLRSQLLRQRILPAGFYDSWCDPSLTLQNLQGTSGTGYFESNQALKHKSEISAGVLMHLNAVWGRATFIVAGLLSNFQYSTPIVGNDVALMFSVVASLFMLSLLNTRTTATSNRPFSHSLVTWFAIAIMFAGMLANASFIARYLSSDGILEGSTISNLWYLRIGLFLTGTTLLILRVKVAAILNWLTFVAVPGIGSSQRQVSSRVLLLALLIPWAILLLLVEDTNHLERFLWLWPMQIIVLAAFATYIPERLQAPRTLMWIGSSLLVFMLLGNSLTTSRVKAWYKDGWPGSDPDEIRAVEYVANQLQGRQQAAIGYQTFIWDFMAKFNIVDPHYKVGAQFDLLFKDRHKISNTNRCAEGVSPHDEFRIVQTKPAGTEAERNWYFDSPLDGSFQFMQQFGLYQVFRKSIQIPFPT